MKLINKIKLASIVRKSKKYTKKSEIENSKFNLQFRNDFLVKKIDKIFKTFKINLIVKGYENLGNGPAMLYGNHQDNIDALVVVSALKKQTGDKNENNKIATFIAKHSLQYRPASRWPLSVINTFFLDRNNIKKSLATFNNFSYFVKENKTFGVIFPEGTRNKEGDIGEFKPGSFKVAKKELIPIIPFTINNSVRGLDETRKEELNIEIIFHKKINPSSFMTQTTTAISERVRNIVKASFVSPQFKFVDVKENDEDIEKTKYAIKFHKKENKLLRKQAKKERLEREQERKLIEAEEKENQKYEKYKAKKEAKLNKDYKHDEGDINE